MVLKKKLAIQIDFCANSESLQIISLLKLNIVNNIFKI